MPTDKNIKYLSVAFVANLFIFLLFAILIIKDVVNNWGELYESLTYFEESIGKSESNNFVIIVFLFSFYFPFVIYLIRLNFSLTAFESNENYYMEYLHRLKPYFKVIEWILRFFVFVVLLLGISQIFEPFNKLVESFFSKIQFPLQYYKIKDGASPYFDIYKGLIPLRKTNLYIIFFFVILLIWDFFLFAFNRICNNKLSAKDFFTRFVKNHIIGLATWVALAFILFTHPVNKLFFKHTFIGVLVLCFLSIIYSISVFKSLLNISKEFSIFLIHHKNDT